MILKKYTDDVTVHYKENEIEYIRFRALEKYSDNIEHLITLRHGGKSLFPVDSLNFRTIGKDSKENVISNLEKTCKNLSITKEQVYKGRQEHTDNILILTDENKEKFKFENYSQENFDGYIVTNKNIATLVTTADCNPIIIYDKNKNIYANIHSGWKGTIKRIYIKTINMMQEKFDSKLEDLIVCIAPSIRKCCFSSEEEEFKENFINTFTNSKEKEYIYYEEDNKRFHIDLIYVIKKDLTDLGVNEQNIHVANICTHCNKEDFYSYRDATKNKYEDYGVMATIVNIK